MIDSLLDFVTDCGDDGGFEYVNEEFDGVCTGEIADDGGIEENRLRVPVRHLFAEAEGDVDPLLELLVGSRATERSKSGVFRHFFEFQTGHPGCSRSTAEREIPENVPAHSGRQFGRGFTTG